MRGFVPDYELLAPSSLSEALALVEDGCRPFAGGTDLMVQLESGRLAHKRFVLLWKLDELRGIGANNAEVRIGALTTYTEVRRSELLRREFPLLAQAAAETGGVATQNRGTLGGNIANASPAADSAPPLLVYDAELELVSRAGIRRRPYHGFHTGYKQIDLEPGELIRAIILPRGRSRWRETFRKVGTRNAQAISKVCLAAAARCEGGRIRQIRIALGSVAPVPLRCVAAESALAGAAAGSVPDFPMEARPVSDIRSTADYRSKVARRLVEDFLRSLG